MIINLSDMRGKTLAELGVKPGWFCQHSGCSIWVEVLEVWDNMLLVVARRPADQTDLVTHHPSRYSGIWTLSDELPNGYWIRGVGLNRRKNFYDKFHPELTRIIPSRQRIVMRDYRSRESRSA